MFDLSFTRNPEWIARRQEYWVALEKELSDGYSKSEVKQWMSYAKTGVVPKILKISPNALMELFPVFSLEGLNYCLKDLISENVTDEQFIRIQTFFYSDINCVYNIGYDEKLTWFSYVFGDFYDPNRIFPFQIGKEKVGRRMTVPPSHTFSVGLDCLRSWFLNSEEQKPVWVERLGFLYSILPYLDIRIFRLGEKERKGEKLPYYGRTDVIQAKLYRVFECCLRYAGVAADPVLDVERREFAKKFVARLEALDSWPEGLRELWESAKQEFAHGN